MSLIGKITEIQKYIRENQYQNESAISIGVVIPILEELGWVVSNPNVVKPEYSIGGGRVDYALLDQRDRAVIFIEVKMLGNTEGAEKQLFEYAFHQGVPFLVLTDGREWNFYLPLEQGNYLDRKLFKLDLLERNSDFIVDKFNKYLLNNRVINGVALEEAKKEFKEISRRREAERYIPQAWQSLITSSNDSLLDLLIDTVEGLCGLRPERKSCQQFLKDYSPKDVHKKSPKPTQGENEKIQGANRQIGYRYNNQFFPENSARNVMINIFKLLQKRDPTFLNRFSQSLPNGKRRKIISKNIMELYPNRPDFFNDSSMVREFMSNWYIGLNYSRKSIEQIINQVINFAGLQKNKDIDFFLG
jgi:hypothetical protein